MGEEMTANVFVWVHNAEEILAYGAKPYWDLQIGNEPSSWRPEQGYVLVGETSIELPEVQQEQLRLKTIEAMKAALQKHRADAEVKAQELQQRINDLLMIGHSVDETHV